MNKIKRLKKKNV